jgi:hypothetical protein
MTEHPIQIFESPGEGNTTEVIRGVIKRACSGDIQAIIVASISGRTAIQTAEHLFECDHKIPIVCVSGPPSWEQYPEYKFPLIAREEREKLDKLGIKVIDWIEEPFKSITFRNWWEKETLEVKWPEAGLFWMTLICVGGHGLRTAVEVVFMAVEAGAVPIYDRVIGIAGTGRGVDSAIVMRATRFEDAVGTDSDKRLKIEEILAMPKQTTWVGYG